MTEFTQSLRGQQRVMCRDYTWQQTGGKVFKQSLTGLPSQILNLYQTKWALACVCFSFCFILFCFWLRVLD